MTENEDRARRKIKRYRRMTPMQRFQIGMEMNNLAQVMVRTLLSLRYPTWTVEEVDRKAKRLFLLEARVSEEVLEQIGLGNGNGAT